ncbi:MAG: hypothetical protein HY986_17970 [Candidatus Melainabacteria bacterium]|nr:hypothetical protein [Candidatus Melainabacteria bacterium]
MALVTEAHKTTATGAGSVGAATDESALSGHESRAGLARLFIFSYLVQGLSQNFGVVSQTLNCYLKDGLGFDAAGVSSFMAVLLLPWMIKPVYGILADLFPGEGGASSTYLWLGNVICAVFYFFLALFLSTSPEMAPQFSAAFSIFLIMSANVGMALATVIAIGIAASQEDGGGTRRFLAYQGTAYYLANIAALLLSGILAQMFPPARALALSAFLAALPPSLVAIYLLPQLAPELPRLRRASGRVGFAALAAGVCGASRNLPPLLKDSRFLATAGFLMLWNFSPSLGVSLYFFERDRLDFSPQLIGQLGACSSLGLLLGSLLFFRLTSLACTRRYTALMIALSCLVTLSYLGLHDSLSAFLIEFVRGLTSGIFTLSLYGMAADACPRQWRTSLMAVLICLFNLAAEGGVLLGGQLYSAVCRPFFGGSLLPLLVVSVFTTSCCFFFLPAIYKIRRT